MVELVGQIGDKVLEVSELQRAPHLLVGVGVKGVEVHPQGAREQHGILDGDGGQQIVIHRPTVRFGKTESSQRMRRKIRLIVYFITLLMTGVSANSLRDKNQAPPSGCCCGCT